MFLASFAVTPGDQEIPSLPVCLSPVAKLSFRNLCRHRKWVWRCGGWMCVPKGDDEITGASFFLDFFLKMLNFFFFFLSSCRALGCSEQMLPQCFSLSPTPTHHLLHQSPSTPISSASFTSDPPSRPSICCAELRQYCLRRLLAPGIYN